MSDDGYAIRSEGDVTIVDLSGVIDGSAEQKMQSSFEQALSAGPGSIALNFNDVSYINSTGIALVVGLLAQARRSQRELRAFGLTSHYQEIFEITRLVDFMTIYDDEPSAIAAGT